MKWIKTFEEWKVSESYLNEGRHEAVFTESSGGKNILLFRGQSEKFYEEAPQGYSDLYGMLFTSSDINNAYFYTKPKQNNVREILVFEVPNNIMRINGKYIDRAGDEIKKAKAEGYDGVTSNVAELMFDEGEVGLFKVYKPIAKYQTTNGAFDPKDVQEMKKYGLSQFNVTKEKELYESFIFESKSVKDVHLQTRKTKSVKDSAYPFYVIKDYMDVGYWDRVKEPDFKKAFDEVISFLLQPNSNTERLSKEYKWMTEYDELWQYQQNKQD